jgi:hypothetical protein
MNPQGSKKKEDPKHYGTSHRIKGRIKLFTLYYTPKWINTKINTMISTMISTILNPKSLLTLAYLG